jgi:hypothetical protein
MYGDKYCHRDSNVGTVSIYICYRSKWVELYSNMQCVRYSLYCIDRVFWCSDIWPCGSVLQSADLLSPPHACFNTSLWKWHFSSWRNRSLSLSPVGTLTRYRALTAALWLGWRERGSREVGEGDVVDTQRRGTRLELVPWTGDSTWRLRDTKHDYLYSKESSVSSWHHGAQATMMS